MTRVSQNGWPADPPRSARTIPGTGVAVTVADGPAGDVLMYVLARFDREVEDIDLRSTRGEFDDWGFADRNVRGSQDVSNHASATAVDVNATRHPLGVRGTFSPVQVGAIHAILADVQNVVRWGGDYSGRVDEMHFEINADEKTVTAVARTLTLDSGEEGSMTPNDLLMAGLWYTYPTAAQAKAAGLPVVNGKQELTEKHPLGEWIAVHCIRQGMILAEAQKHTALLTLIREALTASSGTGKKSS